MKNIIKKYLTEEVNSKREKFFNYIINDYLSDVKFLLVDDILGDVWAKLPGISHPNTWMDIYHMKQKEGLPYHVMETFSKYGFEKTDIDNIRKIWHEILRLISIKMREINENRDSYEINQVITINESEDKKNRFNNWLVNNIKPPYYNSLKKLGLSDDKETIDTLFVSIFGNDYYYYESQNQMLFEVYNNSNEVIYMERIDVGIYWFFKYNRRGRLTYQEEYDLDQKLSTYKYWVYDEDNVMIETFTVNKKIPFDQLKDITPEGSVLDEKNYTPWI